MPVETTENYVRIRQNEPGKYVRMRIKILSESEGIKAVIGFLEGGGSEVQSFLFDKDKWTVAEAEKWIVEHKDTKKFLENDSWEDCNVNLIYSIKGIYNFAKAIEITEGVPTIFKNTQFEAGRYSYGEITSTEVDSDGDRVFVGDEILAQLVEPPYNKIYIGHKQNEIPAGVIKFAGRIPEYDNPIIVEKLNEGHPNADNIWKSQMEGALDAYSISGKAEKVKEFNKKTGVYENIVKVRMLSEVSKVGTPANKNAMMHGLFIAKSMGEGVMFEEESKMPEQNYITKEEFEAFKKEMLDKVELINKGFEEFKKQSEPAKVEPVVVKPVEPSEVKPVETEPVKLEEPKKEELVAKAEETKSEIIQKTVEPDLSKKLISTKPIMSIDKEPTRKADSFLKLLSKPNAVII